MDRRGAALSHHGERAVVPDAPDGAGREVPEGATCDGAAGPEHEPAAPFPLQRFLGMVIEVNGPGHATARLAVSPEHHNPNGVVHGAVLFAMVDTAMGRATMSVLEDGRFCASVEVHLRFIRAARDGELIADAAVVRPGRNIVHLDGRVHDEGGRLIATASGTFAVLG